LPLYSFGFAPCDCRNVIVADRNLRADRWNDEEDAAAVAAFQPLTREQAEALRRSQPTVSPWRVIAAQAAIGVVCAAVAGFVSGSAGIGWSALYGAAVVVIPGALMARGMTSRLSSMSPGVGAASFLVWEMAKIGASIVMLMLAPRFVEPLSWPALLAAMVLCMKVYWLALLWGGRADRGARARGQD
jgi:ATP synthase protein I